MPEKKKTTTTRKTTTTTASKRAAIPAKAAAKTAAAAAGRVASGRGSRPRRSADVARQATGSYETRLPSTRPAAGKALVHGRRKTRVGRVASAKTPRTVIVEIERLREHPLYKKVIRVRKRVPAHDSGGDVKAGDLVRIQESRPFSATKRWQVVAVLSLINVVRIATLVRVVEFRPALFVYFHEYIWQGAFLMLVTLYAMTWVEWARR